MKLPEDVVEFFELLDTQRREAAEEFYEILVVVEPAFAVAMKWNRPTFTVHGNWHHLCAVQPAKGRVSLEFHKGVLLKDPLRLLQGDAKYVRRFTVTEAAQINLDELAPIILDAVAKQTE